MRNLPTEDRGLVYPRGKKKVLRISQINGVVYIAREFKYPFHHGEARRGYRLTAASKGRLFGIINQAVKQKSVEVTLAANGFMVDY